MHPVRISRVAVVVAAGALLFAAACSGGGSSAKATTTTTAARANSTTTVRTAPAPGPDLAALMPTTVPSGYALQADTVGDTGPSDLDKAVRDDGTSDARSVLTRAGFLRGFQRLWLAPGSEDQNILFLYQFRDPTGANEYLTHTRGQLSDTGGGPTPVPFGVPGIPGASAASASDSTGSAAVIVFARGPYVVQAVANGKGGTDQRQGVIALAQAQYGRLPVS